MENTNNTKRIFLSPEMENAFKIVMGKKEVPTFEAFVREWDEMSVEERAVYIMHQDCPELFEVIADERENRADWWATIDTYVETIGFPRMTCDLSPEELEMYKVEAQMLMTIYNEIEKTSTDDMLSAAIL